MKKTLLNGILLFFFLLLLAGCGGSSGENTTDVEKAEQASGAAVEEAPTEEVKPVVQLPSVVLYPDLSVWSQDPEDNTKVGKELDEGLSLGSAVVSNSETAKMKFSTGSEVEFVKVEYGNEDNAWMSSWWVIENAVPGVIMKDALLYKAPTYSEPTEKGDIVKSGTIVAVHSGEENRNGFVKITWTDFNNNNSLEKKASRYVQRSVISSSKEDLLSAQMNFKAMQKPENLTLFLERAMGKETWLNRKVAMGSLEIPVTLYGSPGDLENEVTTIMTLEPPVIVYNGYREIVDGEVWQFAKADFEEGDDVYGWIQQNAYPFVEDDSYPVVSVKETGAKAISGLDPGVVLLNGLSLREVPEPGKGYIRGLELGELVYSDGNIKKADDGTVYLEVTTAYGEKGWTASYWIVEKASPAVLLNDTYIFNDDKEDALTGNQAPFGTIIALVDEETKGDFVKVAWADKDDPDSLNIGKYFLLNEANISEDPALVTKTRLLLLATRAYQDENLELAKNLARGVLSVPVENMDFMPNDFQSQFIQLNNLLMQDDK